MATKRMESLITSNHTENTGGNGYKLHWERFHPDLRKKFLTERALNDWKTLSMDEVDSPSLEILKMQLDRVLGSLLVAPFPMKVWTG